MSLKKQKLHLDKWLMRDVEIVIHRCWLRLAGHGAPIPLHCLADMLFVAAGFCLTFTTHADFLSGFSIQFSIDSFSIFHIYKCLLINIESIEKITREVEKYFTILSVASNTRHNASLFNLLWPTIITGGGLPLQSGV